MCLTLIALEVSQERLVDGPVPDGRARVHGSH